MADVYDAGESYAAGDDEPRAAGAVWLHDLPTVISRAGLVVATYPGWETRARSTGGYDDLRAVQIHHTASKTTPANDMAYCWKNSPDKPVGAIYLARDGLVTVGAAGATNTSGKGGPMATSRGTIPLDAANRYVLSIEAANDGRGEQWPTAQVNAYKRLVRALCDAYGLRVAPGDVHAHWEWTTRKVDPAGNSPYATGANKWNMDAFRRDVSAVGNNPAPTPPPPNPIGTDVLVNLVSYKNELAVWAQYSGGYKIWVPDANVLNILKLVSGIKTVAKFDDAWFLATGPVLPGTPLPYSCDAYGRKR